MAQIVDGVVRGGKIELVNGPELADGRRVQVVIGPEQEVAQSDPLGPTAEEGTIHTPAGPELVRLLDEIRRRHRPLPPSPTGPGRKSAAGLLADDPEFDFIMAEIERELRADYGREVPGWDAVRRGHSESRQVQ